MQERQKKSTRTIGAEYEQAAVNYLRSLGWIILDRNFHSPFGEIDIIGVDGDTLVFVEVKYRRRTRYGTPEMAVNAAKQMKIYRTAQLYMKAKCYTERQLCRFDVIAVQGEHVEHFRDAFGGF